MGARDNTKYKTIVAGIKAIVTNGRGKMVYMDAFDSCINEIFGVPHFSRKLNEAYSNREIIDIIERVGSDYLYEIFTNKRLRGIISEMTQMDRRIHILRKELRKQGKKGHRDKYDLKEYDWLRKTFKNSAKYMRNRFGIKNNKTAYKRRYKNISEVLKSRDDDYEFASFTFGDDDYYDDYDYDHRSYRDNYDDDYYDDNSYDNYDDTSELQDFEEMMNGPRRRRVSRTRPSRSRRLEWDDDDDDEYLKFEDDDLEKKVDKLSDTIMYLSEAVQFLTNKSTHDSARIRNLRDYAVKDMRNHRENDYVSALGGTPRSTNVQLETEVGIITDFINKLGEDVIALKNNNKVMAEAMDRIIGQNADIIETFNAIFDDDEEDAEEEINYSVEAAFTKPKVVGNSLNELVNHVEDPYEMDDSEETSDGTVGVTVGELVDQINKSNDVKPAEPKPAETVETSTDNK